MAKKPVKIEMDRRSFVQCKDNIWRERLDSGLPALGFRFGAKEDPYFIEDENSLDVLTTEWLKAKGEKNV